MEEKKEFVFSVSQKEMLIEAVKEYKCLYAHTEKSYHDNVLHENAWRKVAIKVFCVSEEELIDQEKEREFYF